MSTISLTQRRALFGAAQGGPARAASRAAGIRYAVGLVVLVVGLAAVLQAGRSLPSAEPPLAGKALPAPASSAPDKRAALDAYGKLPLAFVANAGQLDSRVRYAAQAAGVRFSFTQKDVVLAFSNGNKAVALQLTFLGANPKTTIRGRRLRAGRVNYLLGSDPARWHTGLPTYGQVVYRDLWPGVDMVFGGAAGRLKYEFLLRPGAKVQRIRLAYRGADGLSVDKAGGLRIRTALGVLTDTRPRSYQQVGGRRVPVGSRFALGGKPATAFGFAVGRYDPRRPLVIDPGLAYSTFLGGSGFDVGTIAVDAAGNAYLAGQTSSADFPTSAGVLDAGLSGNYDAFVAKLNPAGSALLYSTFLGGSSNDAGNGIRLDASGDAYLTGSTISADFPTSPGAFDTSYNGGTDAFVAKLNPAGSALLYSTLLGGSGSTSGSGIALDAAGDAYVTGNTDAADFPTTVDAFDTSFNGGQDVFVAKLNPAGSALLYSTLLGGSGSADYDQAFAIALDAAGDAYVTGNTDAADFPTSPGAFDTSHNGGQDVFVTKLDPAGSALLYSSFLGGSADDLALGIALDAAGDAYVTGMTSSANFPTSAGVLDASLSGSSDAFVAKLNPGGSALLYSSFLGGSADDQGVGIALDPGGDAYLTGMTSSQDFPTTMGAFDTSFNGGSSGVGDAFVTKLNPGGSALLYSSFLGGSSGDGAVGIALDAAGGAYATGNTTSADFPTSQGAFDTSHNGDWDAFVTKLAVSANHAPVARDDSYATDQDAPLTVPAPGVLANDGDGDGDPLTAALASGPAHGTLALNPDGAFTYTPAAGFAGRDSFTYKASDGLADSDAATVTITVDTPPVAGDDGYGTAEDTPLRVPAPGVLANDTDVDGDPLTAALVAGPAHGTLTLSADGSFAYTPVADFNGSDGFTYKASDGRADSNAATVAITVSEVNDPPTAVADQATLAANTSTVVDVTANDAPGPANEAGQALSVGSVGQPAHGQAAIVTGGADAGKVSYTPAADYAGSDSFAYTVCDDGTTDAHADPRCDTASVEVTVTAPVSANHAPVAQDDGYGTDEDAPLTVAAPGVLANDGDADGDPLAAVLVTGPAHGTLTLHADGSFAYTPAANFNGGDAFTYQASDGRAYSNVASVTITVASVPDAPVAQDDRLQTYEDLPLTVPAPGVLANDGDGDGDPLTAVLMDGPAHGTLALNPDGSFTYAPAANFNGSDAFTYKASDGSPTSNLATVTITVSAVPDAPVAGDDSYSTSQGTPIQVLRPGVLANDSDADGDRLSALLVTGPAHGRLTLNTDGSFTYTPAAGFFGQDSFTYQASDGLRGGNKSNVATVTITVPPPAGTPLARDDSYNTSQDTSLIVPAPGVLANDSDPDGNPLTAVLVSGSGRVIGTAHGTLSLSSNGAFHYTPARGFLGQDSFTYVASDGTHTSNVATVTITVSPPVLFTSTRDGNEDIYVMKSDGSGVTRLTTDTAADKNPAWSPDHRRIAFTSSRDGNEEIYVMNANGTAPTRLTNNSVVDATPAWSPDGTKIAFARGSGSSSDIYVMKADGTTPTRVTTSPAADATPTWTADGGLAFSSMRDGNWEIYVMVATGEAGCRTRTCTITKRLTTNPGIDTSPSSLGTRIAFASTRDGNSEIYVMNADGTAQTRVTNDSASDATPAGSPGGHRIAFASTRDDPNSDIYAMNADGTDVVRLTTNPASDTFPDW